MMSQTKFKQTEIGKIPEDWEEKTINSICDVTSSKRIFLSDYVKSGVIFYRSKEIILKANGERINDPLFITEHKFKEIDSKFGSPKEGDILLTSVGTLGIPYMVQKGERFYFKDGNLTWFKNFKESINKNYILHWLNSSLAKDQINAVAIGSTQQALTIEAIKKLKLNLPKNPSEQQAIASILSSLDSKIELNNKMNKTLETIGQTIFKKWFIDNPEKEKWTITKIGKELKTVLGGTPDRTKSQYWGGDINWINSGKVNEFRITTASEKITQEGLDKSATKLLPKNTTVLAITGATLGQVSRLEIDTCANQSVIGIIENEKIPSEFIYFLIKENIQEIISHQTGGAQQHINKNNIDNFEFVLPDENTLEEFVMVARPIFSLISKNCFENQSLSQIRDVLLPKLMSGEIRVPIK